MNFSFYQHHGYLILENLVSASEIYSLKEKAQNLLQSSIHSENQTLNNTEYFLKSSSNISVFRDSFQNIDKIGHALHIHNPTFKQFTHKPIFRDICQNLAILNPLITQSMYLLKHPNSSKVDPHQDSTFIHTTPLSCIAFWIPLDEVTVDNGCLWVIPGSHTSDLKTRFKYKDSKLVFDPPTKEDYQDEWLPLPMKPGSVLIMHGSLIHKSEKSVSTMNRREVYSFHVVSKDSEWSEDNWIQKNVLMDL